MSIALQAFWRLIRHDTTRYDTILVDCDDLQCSAGCCATCPLSQWQSDMISDMSLFFFAFFIFLHSWDDTQKMPSWVLHDFDPVASLRRRIHFFIRQCCQACKKFALSLFWQLFQVVLLAIPRKKGVDWLWRVFRNWSHSWFCDYFCDCAGLGDIPQQSTKALLISLKAGEDQERSCIRNAALRNSQVIVKVDIGQYWTLWRIDHCEGDISPRSIGYDSLTNESNGLSQSRLRAMSSSFKT